MIEGFSSFGAPLLEGFETVNANDTDCFYRKDGNDKEAKYCLVEKEAEVDPEEIEAEIEGVEEEIEEVEEELKEEEEGDAEEEEEDEGEEDEGEDITQNELEEAAAEEAKAKAEEEEEEVTKTTQVVEGFSGNVSIRQLMNLNLLLKSILFGCLFYILAHPNTRSFVAKNIFKKLKKSQYLYVAMVLFIVVYYVLNLVV